MKKHTIEKFAIKSVWLCTAEMALSCFLGCAQASNNNEGCTPEESKRCVCTDGRSGVKVCLEDGTFGPCECGDASEDTDDPSDDNEFCGNGICSETENIDNCPHDCGVKRIFVTKAIYWGDLKTAGDATSGMEGADNICNITAAAAELGGTWKAWLSDSTIDAIDRIADVGPWYLVDGSEKVFNNKANLRTSPLTPICKDENGQEIISATSLVWTGTQFGGRGNIGNCDNWTVVARFTSGYSGSCNSQDSGWTDSGASECSSIEAHLYCIEQ